MIKHGFMLVLCLILINDIYTDKLVPTEQHKVQVFCFLDKVVGNCNDTVTRWYFDKVDAKCKQFVYSGCGANENNFENEHGCRDRCQNSAIGNKSVEAGGSCLQTRRSIVEKGVAPGTFVPNCQSDGTFSARQCLGSTSECWCVDPQTGREIDRTRTGPGQENVFCNEGSKKCPVESPLKDESGKEIFCGTGSNHRDCPQGYTCSEHPTGAYAVCCKNAVLPTVEPKIVRRPNGEHGLLTDSSEKLGVNHAEVIEDRMRGGARRIEQPENDTSIDEFPATNQSLSLPVGACAKAEKTPNFTPRCTSEGYFEWVQCDNQQNCWCVQPDTGEEMEGTRKNGHVLCLDCIASGPMLSTFRPACDISFAAPMRMYKTCPPFAKTCGCLDFRTGKEIEQLTVKSGETTPQCDFMPTFRGGCNASEVHDIGQQQCSINGFYSPFQCDFKNGYSCYCVDPENQNEIPNTRLRGDENREQQYNPCPKCIMSKLVALDYLAFGSFVPQCTKEKGFFNPLQCNNRTGVCFCVYSDGTVVPGTRRNISAGLPDCKETNRSIANNQFNRSSIEDSAETVSFNPIHSPQNLETVNIPGNDGVMSHGRCEVGTGVKCTEEGFYDWVQCDGRQDGYCWCVHPETGVELEGSRKSGKILCTDCLGLAPLVLNNAPKCDIASHNVKANATVCPPFAKMCGCFDAASGSMLPGRESVPGQPMPNCEFLPTVRGQCNVSTLTKDSCTKNGFFVPIQCNNNTECWCVDPESGKEISGSRVSGRALPPKCSKCHFARALALDYFPFAFLPQCSETGDFFPAQCDSKTSTCFCVDRNGVITPGSRISATPSNPPECRADSGASIAVTNIESSIDQESPCTKLVKTAQENRFVGSFVPKCTPTGAFAPLQCHGSTGQCWCVHENGTEVNGTRILPGEQQPNCVRTETSNTTSSAQPSSVGVRNSRVGGSQDNERIGTDNDRPVGPCTSVKNTLLPGAFVPKCTAWGDYEPEQCHGSTGQCWCVDLNGTEIANSRILPGQRRTDCKFHGSIRNSNESSIDARHSRLGASLENDKNLTEDGRSAGPCATQLKSIKDPTLPGAFVPKCTAWGDYEPEQCHGSLGQCWCVDLNGTEIAGSRVLPGHGRTNCKFQESPQGPPRSNVLSTASASVSCQNILEKLQKTDNPPGTFVPNCTANGGYEPMQCSSSSGQCWCVFSDGTEVPGTRGRPGEKVGGCHTTGDESTEPSSCQKVFEAVRNAPPGTFIPKCTLSGDYESLQCHGSTGQCWCVQRNGVEIAGTRGQPGQNVTCPTLRSLIESFGVVSSCQSAFDSVRNAPPGTFIPKCTVAGDYEPTQCHGSTGQCWCVTKNGTEIIGTRGQPGQNVTCQSQGGETVSTEKPPSCRIVLEKVQNAPLPGAFVPKCTVSGEYERTQCHGSTGQCFCVTSDGTEIPGTRGQPGENITCQSQGKKYFENGSTSCRTALEKIGSAPPPGTFIPKCTVLGDYEPTQCHGSTGQCFCVSSDGTEIPGTRVQPGQNVTCTSSRTGSSATESSSCRQVLERVGNAPPGTYIPQCTISGGYEQTQCHGSTGQCWCVTETGSEISGTRVQPGQKATCKSQGQSSTDTGPCRRVLQSMGSEPPPPGRFVPQCTALGDYEPKQCHGSTGQCWCVTKNGTEIEGSRVQPGQNTICKQDVVSIQPSIEQPPLVVPQQGLGSSVICVKAKDRGSCIDNNNQSSVARWYYNGDKSSCLVFKYSGCAGNENNFKSKTECEMRCKPQDGPTCNGNSAAPIFATTAGSVNESANTNANVSLNGTFRRNPTCVNVQCPVGFKCRSGWIAPSCCNASIEEVFEDAYSKTCKNGRKAYAQKFDYKDYVQAYFGDSCDDLPCPTGFECQQTSSMFAKCCATSDIAEIGDTEPSSRPTSSCPYGPALTNKETGGTFACNPRKSCPAESFCSSNSTQDPSDSSYREGICCIEQKVPTALKRVFAKENCSADIRDKIDICLQPFSNLTQRIYKFVSFSAGNVDQLLPQNGSIESLNEACSKYSDYHTCTSTLLKPYCYSHSNALVEEILGFACQPQSITTLTNNRKCLESASSDPAVQFCVTQFSQTLRLLNDGSSASFGALCSSVERFVDCSSLPIAKNCSADLAPLLKQLVNRTITAMFGATCEDVVREEQKELSLNVFTDVGCTKDQSEALRFCTKKLVASPIISSKLVQPYNGASLLATNEQLALLDDFCAQYKEFEICTQPVSLTNDKCKPFLYKALVDVVGFNCRNENVQLWKQYGFCLSKLVNRTDVRPCFDKLERMQENFNSTEFGVDTPIRSLCDQTEEYIECMRQPITDQCGKNAFDFHKAVFSNAKKTLFTPCFQLQNGKLENVDAANTQQIIIDIGTGHQTAETVPLAFTPTFQPELGVVTTTLQPGFQPVFTSASPDNVDPTDSSQKSCALKRDSMLWANTVPSGQYIPQCKDNGNYAPTQCDAAKGTCWCVNELTGEEISGTLVHSSENKTPSCGTCHKERSATTASSSFVPMCQDNGKYQPLQCSIESGYCWCVDVETGAEVNGSKVGPGKKLPTCGVSEVYACGRLPFKMQCLPDGSKPQEVFRWYRDGSKCKMYRFSYCVAESHVPPYPLKEQKDCEELCIGRQLDFVPVKN